MTVTIPVLRSSAQSTTADTHTVSPYDRTYTVQRSSTGPSMYDVTQNGVLAMVYGPHHEQDRVVHGELNLLHYATIVCDTRGRTPATVAQRHNGHATHGRQNQ